MNALIDMLLELALAGEVKLETIPQSFEWKLTMQGIMQAYVYVGQLDVIIERARAGSPPDEIHDRRPTSGAADRLHNS